jgi:hypothetical protein
MRVQPPPQVWNLNLWIGGLRMTKIVAVLAFVAFMLAVYLDALGALTARIAGLKKRRGPWASVSS